MTHQAAAFWMVCRKPTHRNAQTNPRVRYAHIDAARDAARKLARENDADFVILECVETIRPTDRLTKTLI